MILVTYDARRMATHLTSNDKAEIYSWSYLIIRGEEQPPSTHTHSRVYPHLFSKVQPDEQVPDWISTRLGTLQAFAKLLNRILVTHVLGN